MYAVTDFHSHILPGIDDGSASVQESIALLQMEAAQGIRHVVATPHFYANYDSPERFLRRRETAEMCLREEMAKYSGLPEISVGAEVYFFSGISHCEVLPQLTIGGKRCILIEMPQAPWTNTMYRELEDIAQRWDITPILAHVDRYIGPFRTHGIPERLGELPVLVQANASFFLNKSTRRMALRMLKRNQIQLLGSDCHSVQERPPRLGAAIEIISARLGRQVLAGIEEYQDSVL